MQLRKYIFPNFRMNDLNVSQILDVLNVKDHQIYLFPKAIYPNPVIIDGYSCNI